MLALVLMMPLLTLYSNLLGIAGGFVVGIGLLGITPAPGQLRRILQIAIEDGALQRLWTHQPVTLAAQALQQHRQFITG